MPRCFYIKRNVLIKFLCTRVIKKLCIQYVLSNKNSNGHSVCTYANMNYTM